MSDSIQQSKSLVPKTPLQDVQPPEIQITTVSSEGMNTEPVPDNLEEPRIAEQTIPEASTALPGTAGADAQNADSAAPTSPAHPTEILEGPLPKSGKQSTDPPLKSLLHSFTEPTTAKPSDGMVPAAVDPKTGVTKVSPR